MKMKQTRNMNSLSPRIIMTTTTRKFINARIETTSVGMQLEIESDITTINKKT